MLAMALVLAAATPVVDRTEDIAALREAKLVAWPALYENNDADGLSRFLTDDFVVLNADGSSEKKADVIAWVRANKWANADNGFRYDIQDIVFYGPDTANVFGVGSFNGKGPDGACRLRYTSANIFVQQDGRWRPAFSHTSATACVKNDK